MVPTISILLGLPIPYANLGGIAPTLLGYEGIRDTAAALALNAAQVWRYFDIYSRTANMLPRLPELKEQLDEAVDAYSHIVDNYWGTIAADKASRQLELLQPKTDPAKVEKDDWNLQDLVQP